MRCLKIPAHAPPYSDGLAGGQGEALGCHPLVPPSPLTVGGRHLHCACPPKCHMAWTAWIRARPPLGPAAMWCDEECGVRSHPVLVLAGKGGYERLCFLAVSWLSTGWASQGSVRSGPVVRVSIRSGLLSAVQPPRTTSPGTATGRGKRPKTRPTRRGLRSLTSTQCVKEPTRRAASWQSLLARPRGRGRTPPRPSRSRLCWNHRALPRRRGRLLHAPHPQTGRSTVPAVPPTTSCFPPG